VGKKPLPELPDTGRHYLGDTMRARLASPGIQRYAPKRGHGAQVAVALVVVAAVLIALLFLR
jgi:hypothetical protein